jgi:hypothetical protein
MRVPFTALLLACLALPAAAQEIALRLPGNSYAGTVPGPSAKAAPAPVTTESLAERAPAMRLAPGPACGASEFEVCLDSTGRITVPGARRYMPELPGLTPERLTIKRSGVVLGYSF